MAGTGSILMSENWCFAMKNAQNFVLKLFPTPVPHRWKSLRGEMGSGPTKPHCAYVCVVHACIPACTCVHTCVHVQPESVCARVWVCG